MTGNNPIDRSKLGQAKRHILTDKNDISAFCYNNISKAHDIKQVTNVIDNSVIKRTFVSGKPKKSMSLYKDHHLCLDKAYKSKSIEQEIIKRGYVPHIPYKRERSQLRKITGQKKIFSFPKINDGLSRERERERKERERERTNLDGMLRFLKAVYKMMERRLKRTTLVTYTI